MSKIRDKIQDPCQNSQKLRQKNGPLIAVHQLWQKLLVSLFRRKEIKITLRVDDAGNVWWSADDPVTKCTITRESEAELLQAIDRWQV